MLQATHAVSKDVIDPVSGQRCLCAGQRVKVVSLGDHAYVWAVPFDATTRPVSIQHWLVSLNLVPLEPGSGAGPEQ
jgi:hypothetical protein